MSTNRVAAVMSMTAIFALSACVAPPPRERVVYHEGGDHGAGPHYCRFCGTVRDVDQVEIRQQNSGGGAVLGAIIGGLIGNQFGRGGGRAAATAAGVVAGAAVGNSAENDNGRRASGYAWRFRILLDDGQWAQVTQYDNPGFHPGDRVIINGQHLDYLRR